jgi:hypothetical protein
MSFDASCPVSVPGPVPIPPLRAGETDGRYIDVSTDLGVVGDHVTSIATVSIAIARADNAAHTSGDLRLAGASWPNSLDASGLRITVGFTAPQASAGVPYWVTLQVNTTNQGRLYIRDLTMVVAPVMG